MAATADEIPLRVEFDRLHGISVNLEGAVLLIGIAVAVSYGAKQAFSDFPPAEAALRSSSSRAASARSLHPAWLRMLSPRAPGSSFGGLRHGSLLHGVRFLACASW